MKLPIISISGEELSNFDDAKTKEWLVTNGLGGYASSTILGINTRKYHGLLVAALNPPGNRNVCLAKLDEEVTVGKDVYLLGANEFHDAVFPKGFMHLKEFSVSPFPKYSYSLPNVEIQKTIFMPTGKNAAIVMYQVQNRNPEAQIKLFPLLTCRHFHAVVDKSVNPLSLSQKQSGRREVQVTSNTPKGVITVRATDGEFQEKPNWIERLRYREDEMREESSVDDCYQAGYFEVTVPADGKKEFAVITAASEDSQQNVKALNEIGSAVSETKRAFQNELKRRNDILANFFYSHKTTPASDWLSWILLASDAFIVSGANDRRSVIAGYHWYEAWGRDTFISLPGLMLVTGKFEYARNVLSEFNSHCHHGLIPNFLKDKSGTASYNTVDGTLWYINAVLQYLKYTGDFGFIRDELWENLKDIVENHVKGTDFNIHMDTDGLLSHGEQLTWMDAKVNEKAITPRAGKAVEIQALWYNALRTVQLLAERFEEDSAEYYAALAKRAQTSFVEKFWNIERQCLFDVVEEHETDASLRPNQIIAVALDFAMLDQKKNEQIVNVVQRELLTPCGLRTLERNDPKYKGIYFGDRWSRDSAYHNGTVWPWLLGPFTKAFLKTKGCTPQNREFALKNFLSPLFTQQVHHAGLGTVNEIFDGDAPHVPRGCISQAWSVTEPLRAYVEDVMQAGPKHEREVLQS
jgi:predicted glycogen debranching enzyme